MIECVKMCIVIECMCIVIECVKMCIVIECMCIVIECVKMIGMSLEFLFLDYYSIIPCSGQWALLPGEDRMLGKEEWEWLCD